MHKRSKSYAQNDFSYAQKSENSFWPSAAYAQIQFSYAQKVKILCTKTGSPMHNIDISLSTY
jgi:hypothetical protein